MNSLLNICRWLFAMVLLLLPSFRAAAQIEHSLLVGGGSANVLDTYLSPYSYHGDNIRVQFDASRQRKDSLIRHSQFDVNAALLNNRAGNVDAYSFGIRYSMAWLFANDKLGVRGARLNVAIGPEASAYVGAVYVDRSGNNPANAHADIMVNAAAHADYAFKVWRKNWKATFKASVPLLGTAFSPNYGQSYYEAFVLGNYDHNVVFANLLNMPSLRYRLTIDIPVGRHQSTFRVGYAGQMLQSTFNNLKYHSYTHDFLIGYSKTLYKR